MSRILIIDDEASIRAVLGDILSDAHYDVSFAENGLEGLQILKTEPIDAVFLDVWLPGKGGIDVLQIIKKSWPDIEVVIISGHATVETAVKTIKLGAYDYLEKPLDMSRILTLARNAVQMENLRRENTALRQKHDTEDEMIGNTNEIQSIKERVKQSASSQSKIMILGESGTGKELVARMIHTCSPRSSGPFIEINCAAIPDSLIESEIFGHEKGAFTGAIARRRGKFEAADGGTLFFDEVADMSLSAQAKVLRAIQEMSFERLGSEETVRVDVRIISATNKDIRQEVQEGRFREDLYFRLSVIPLLVPPLRERQEDLPLLINYFQRGLSLENPNRKNPLFSQESMALLRKHPWPGNIRELKNFIERISILVDEEEVDEQTTQFYLEKFQAGFPVAGGNREYDTMKLGEARELFECRLLEWRLKENNFNIAKTAQALGIYPSNLHGKIKKYSLKVIP